ncbi:MAG TPA: hypothetical protein VJI33_01355 [Candidatus Paceibacterota bacterium]
MNKIIRIIAVVSVLSVFFPIQLEAQNAIADRKAQLESELLNLESQIAAQTKILQEKQRQSVSLERDVSILNAKIDTAKLNIRARDIKITQLSNDIAGKETTIGVLDDKLEKEKASLAAIIRQTNAVESYSLPEIVLGSKGLSEFFQDVDSYVSIRKALNESFKEIDENKTQTINEKTDLENKKLEQSELKSIQVLEQKKIEQQQAEKARILKESKGEEAIYQSIIKAVEKSAAQIRAELFTLRGSAAIPFEKAYELALEANKKTGVRPAFLLGIIAEESNLGENVGTGNWRVDMKAPRDTVPFLDITSRLGLDPDKMPVSKKPWYGYGGAMGPAQFIPSTWILYEDKIAKLTGHNPPNPWDPGDAFMASAILLADNGAKSRTYATERLAALRYFAGWANATKPAYAFYGDDVMELAAKYQKLIDILNSN